MWKVKPIQDIAHFNTTKFGTGAINAECERTPTQDKRKLETVSLCQSSLQLETMMYGGVRGEGAPLLILHSMEYPMPPSVSFCEQIKACGRQVIFVRRPGFGASPALPKTLYSRVHVESGTSAISEAVLIARFLEHMQLDGVSVLAFGSANPIAYRLAALTKRVQSTVLANPMFNRIAWSAFRPPWLGRMLSQAVLSQNGLWFAEKGLKLMLRNRPLDLFAQFFKNSSGDMAYFDKNQPDYLAAAKIMLNVESAVIYNDIGLNLRHDPFLSDRRFKGIRIAAVAGSEAPDIWTSEMKKECSRLEIPLYTAPSGDLISPYSSIHFLHDTLLETENRQAESALDFLQATEK